MTSSLLRIKAVIFDFDGLILDTETLWYEAFRDIYTSYGQTLALEQYAQVIGTTFAAFDPVAHLASLIDKPLDRDEIIARSADLHKDKMIDLQVREGIIDYLQSASELGLKIGLATSSRRKWLISFLDRFGLTSYFHATSTADDVEHVKPAPDLYLRTLQLLGVKGEEGLAFEDSLNGLRAAKAAGLWCIVVPNPVTAHLPFAQHDGRLSSMADRPLAELIRDIELRMGRYCSDGV